MNPFWDRERVGEGAGGGGDFTEIARRSSMLFYIGEAASRDRHGGHNNRVQTKLLPHPDVNYRELMEFWGR